MKMVKSLLLGSAAGLVAIAGAQAADLPVKAKAVEYVKVCSLYGAGFYYIPGTDICLKVGGHVRADVGINGGSSLSTGPFASGWNTRTADNPWVQRSYYYATFDARSQTAYGTARAYLGLGNLSDTPNAPHTGASYSHRGFIQWAGFTLGQATSFFDFHLYAAYQYTSAMWNDTVALGWRVVAYTAQFGGGFSATVSLEEPRRTTITPAALSGSATATGIPALLASGQTGVRFPDVVGNLRVDQAWGSAQVMGALHDASAAYHPAGGVPGAAGTLADGRAPDQLGWAVGAGVKVNLPTLGAGDSISLQGVYSVGAFRYAAGMATNQFSFNHNNGTLAYGLTTDGLYGGPGINGGNVLLTTAWSVAAAFEHFWRPDLKTSLWANYLAVDYGSPAVTNLILTGPLTYNRDWSMWMVGTRTQWDVSKQLSLGGEVVYAQLNTMARGGAIAIAGSGTTGVPTAGYTYADQSEWSFRFRAQYNFVP